MKFSKPFLVELEKYRQTCAESARYDRYLSLLSPEPGQRVLDLGCGSGWFSRAIAPLVSPEGHVTGVDCAREAIDVARQLTADLDLSGLTFEPGDGHRLKFADETFDAALCISVLAFCQSPDQVLGELRRVLRSGGRLLVANSDEDTRIYGGHDRELGRRIQRAVADRVRDPWLGRRLAYLLKSEGFRILREEIETKVEREFAPKQSGYILAHIMRDYLLNRGGISARDYERWLADLDTCALEGSYCYAVTGYMYLVEV